MSEIAEEAGKPVEFATRKMLSMRQVCERISVHRSTIYCWIEQKTFPSPVELGPGRIAFLDEEVAEWQRARIKQRDAMPAAA